MSFCNSSPIDVAKRFLRIIIVLENYSFIIIYKKYDFIIILYFRFLKISSILFYISFEKLNRYTWFLFKVWLIFSFSQTSVIEIHLGSIIIVTIPSIDNIKKHRVCPFTWVCHFWSVSTTDGGSSVFLAKDILNALLTFLPV